jgi:hypothetical protein
MWIGSTPTRKPPIGAGTMQDEIDRAKTGSAPDRMPGSDIGSVTPKKARLPLDAVADEVQRDGHGVGRRVDPARHVPARGLGDRLGETRHAGAAEHDRLGPLGLGRGRGIDHAGGGQHLVDRRLHRGGAARQAGRRDHAPGRDRGGQGRVVAEAFR